MATFSSDSRPIIAQGPSLVARLLFLGVVSIGIMVLDHRQKYLEVARSWLSSGVYPLQMAVQTPFQAWDWMTGSVADRKQLTVENQEMHAQLRVANLQLLRMAALAQENQQLRAIREASSQLQTRSLVTEIMRVDLDPYRHRVLLNHGKKDGLYKGQAVLDANGANTTAAAAVRLAAKHLDLKTTSALVLGGTGPVGQRVARLLARQGAQVRVASRQQARAASVCETILSRVPGARMEAVGVSNPVELTAAMTGRTLVIAAGAAGVVLLPRTARLACPTLRLAIDLNAVPPLGIEGLELTDKAVERDGILAYGAIGVGGTKMKLHKAALAKLFERNDQVLDAEEVYALNL